jgi:hypothetical protein
MSKKRIEQPNFNYINVDNEVNFYIVQESIINELEKAIPSPIHIISVPIACLGVALTLLRISVIESLSSSINTACIGVAIFFICCALVIGIYLLRKRNSLKETIGKITQAKLNKR